MNILYQYYANNVFICENTSCMLVMYEALCNYNTNCHHELKVIIKSNIDIVLENLHFYVNKNELCFNIINIGHNISYHNINNLKMFLKERIINYNFKMTTLMIDMIVYKYNMINNNLVSGNTTGGNTTLRNTTFGNTTLGNTTLGNTTLGNTTIGNTTIGNTTIGNTTIGNTTIGNTTFGNTTFGNTMYSNTTIGNTTIGNTTIGNTTIGNTTLGNTTIGNTTFGNTTFGNNNIDIISSVSYINEIILDNVELTESPIESPVEEKVK
jgi:hypothetical protein